MTAHLPPTGTTRLLDLVSPYVPDLFIADCWPEGRTGGRRVAFGAAQLWRVHLLALLTSTHSLNLICAQLAEQPAWRRFCRLPSGRMQPGVRMLHEFRERIGVSGFRRINQHLLNQLLRRKGLQPHAVALMDATDLPAACSGFKKKHRHLYGPRRSLGWSHAQNRTKPLVCRLQKAHPPTMAADGPPERNAGAAGQLGQPSQCF